MKAKLKKTGEIINIADYTRITLDNCDSYGNPIEVGLDEVSYLCDDDGLILGMPKFTPSKIFVLAALYEIVIELKKLNNKKDEHKV